MNDNNASVFGDERETNDIAGFVQATKVSRSSQVVVEYMENNGP